MLLTKTVCKNDVKLKLFLKLMQRVYQNIELFFFFFTACLLMCFNKRKMFQNLLKKETHRDLVLCLFSIARLFQAFDKIVTNIKVIHSTGNV